VRVGHHVDVVVPPEPVWYETDENQVRQILWNLATNGLRAMPAGGRLRLSVCCPKGGGIDIAVEDQGCGIAPEDLDRIFQPFHSTFERGTGLGLATVHRIVSDLKGTISVSSAVGTGTTMCVRLPPAASQPVEALALQEAV
jgi:signal transduction histidine kinase